MEWSAVLKLGWIVAPILVALIVVRMTGRRPGNDPTPRPMLWVVNIGLFFVAAFVLLMMNFLADPPIWETLGGMAASYKILHTFVDFG